MREFKRQNYKQFVTRVYAELLGLVILLIIMLLTGHASWDMYTKFALAAGTRETAETELASLRQQEAQVGAVVAELGTQRGMEQEIRERYGYAKPGEGAILIVRESATSTQQNTPPNNIFNSIWHALFPW